jgi:hypothetical protein
MLCGVRYQLVCSVEQSLDGPPSDLVEWKCRTRILRRIWRTGSIFLWQCADPSWSYF